MTKSSDIKIVLITQDHTRITPRLIEKYNLCGLVESDTRRKKSKSIKFLSNLYKQLRRKNSPLKEISTRANIPYFFLQKSNQKDLKTFIHSTQPDLIIVYSMSFLLKEEIFSIPRYGTINLHPSYLPDYRGPNPDFWYYHDMVKEQGVSIHYIDKGEDTGDILCQDKTTIPIGIKSPDRLDILINKMGYDLLCKAVDSINTGNVNRKKQPQSSPTIRAKNIPQNEHQNIIRWNQWPIERIWNLLRGTESWLNAIEQPKGLFYGQRWEVEEYQKMNMDKYTAATIYKEKRYFVACNDGKIFLKKRFNIKRLILAVLEKI